MNIKTVAIANRGEVACRIIMACRELGIKTVLLHSEADRQSRAYRMADTPVCIGPSEVHLSYLDVEKNVAFAKKSGADAIHPGFGFLSENAEFAKRCGEEGMVFIGPSAEAISLLGDKVQSKTLAEKCQVPMVPGYQGEDQSLENLCKKAEGIGFPVIVKAAAGGGGRGMRVIRAADEASAAIEAAQREGQSSFGSPKVFLEKYLDRAKHIEFQIFADSAGTYHLYDRECSVQRKHQKIIEEACSPSLTEELRAKMGEAAVRLVQAAGYKNAGTVEFLLQDGEFYFLEVNTRLQVEHPVTEMVLSIDLVKSQIKAAAGEAVFKDVQFQRCGHSIECRIYAEDSETGMPSTGKLGLIRWPEGSGRYEYGFENGDSITSFYDSMIAKAIVWGPDRPAALYRMDAVLRQSVVFGVQTNIEFLRKIIAHPEFADGSMTTQFINQHFPDGVGEPELNSAEELFASRAWGQLKGSVAEVDSPFRNFWRGL